MAKQRPQPKPKGQSSPQIPPGRRAQPGAVPDRMDSPGTRSAPGGSRSNAPQRRTTYFEAVAVYERGVQALQRHDYTSAIELLSSSPEELATHIRSEIDRWGPVIKKLGLKAE